MLRGLLIGAGTALALSGLLVTAVSLIAPVPAQRARVVAPGGPFMQAPAPPRMAEVETSAPARPDALPRRPAQEVAVIAAPAPAPEAGVEPVPAPPAERATDELAIPAGSQFNRPREDFQPVSPSSEAAPRVAAETPSLRAGVPEPAATPVPDTESAGAPLPGAVVADVVAPVEGEAPTRPATVREGAPQTFREVAPTARAPKTADPVDVETVEVPAGPGPEVGATEIGGFGAPAPIEAPVARISASRDAPEPGAPGPRLALAPAPTGETGVEAEPQGAPVLLESLSSLETAPSLSRSVTRVEVPLVGRGSDAGAMEASPEREIPRRIVLDSDRAVPEPGVSDAARDEAPVAGQPLFSIILIDDPEGGMSRESLAALDVPVTFAIDPRRPDAAEAARVYTEAGHEVLLLGEAFPVGGTARDLEVALAGALAVVPHAVGLLDVPPRGFARNLRALRALLPALDEAGLGYVNAAGGLDRAVAEAERAGVPASRVYRVVDDAGQRATVIARFLDRATFEAVQQGQAVVVGRTRPDTVTALLSWAVGRRADGVAVVPVSGVFDAGEGS